MIRPYMNARDRSILRAARQGAVVGLLVFLLLASTLRACGVIP